MKITFDKEADAMYIYIQSKKVFRTKQITDDTIVDIDKEGNSFKLSITALLPFLILLTFLLLQLLLLPR